MEVKATAKFVRISPRKARLVVDSVRGMKVEEAEKTLQFMNKKAAEPVLKLIRSAAANAVHNNKLAKKDLVISEIFANEGFTMKRYRPRAFGRASKVRKRTSHLSVVLKSTAKPAPAKPAKKAEQKSEKKAEAKKAAPKAEKPKAEKKAPKAKKKTAKKATKKTDAKQTTKKEK